MVIAESERLMLRELQPTDVGPLNAVFGDPMVMRFEEQTYDSQWIVSWISDNTAVKDGVAARAICLKPNNQVIGYCGFFRFDDINGQPEIEIGYRLAHKCWGRGYATEAAKAMVDHAFLELGLSRLIALIDPGNKASMNVAIKLGFEYRDDVMLEGYDHPDRVYVLEKNLKQIT